MKKLITRILQGVFLILVLLFAFIYIRGNRNFDQSVEQVKLPVDSVSLARGKYLVYGPAHCASCHSPLNRSADVDKGIEVPLIGGWQVTIPPGVFRASNLTPDPETGIGNITNEALVRSMRYGINHRNKVMFPFMPFQEMSESDLLSILAYLRSIEPVSNRVEPTEYSLLGKALIAFGALKPNAKSNEISKHITIDTTVAYGQYIATKVANCAGCHTERDLKTGNATGPIFAGGLILPADELSLGKTFVTPNLTPDPETGVMANWTEEHFIARFRSGRIHQGSQMPWGSFSRMNYTELKALFSFFRSLEPIKRKVEKTVFLPNEEIPE